MTDPTVVSVFTTGLADFDGQVLGVAAAAIGVGILVLALTRGWGLVKRFTK